MAKCFDCNDGPCYMNCWPRNRRIEKMVGGRLIEIRELAPGIARLWCVDAKRSDDELAVNVEIAPAMPLVGDEIWWQSGWVYWDKDRRKLRKVSNSYDPRNPA